jgi:hypothetical protein
MPLWIKVEWPRASMESGIPNTDFWNFEQQHYQEQKKKKKKSKSGVNLVALFFDTMKLQELEYDIMVKAPCWFPMNPSSIFPFHRTDEKRAYLKLSFQQWRRYKDTSVNTFCAPVLSIATPGNIQSKQCFHFRMRWYTLPFCRVRYSQISMIIK